MLFSLLGTFFTIQTLTHHLSHSLLRLGVLSGSTLVTQMTPPKTKASLPLVLNPPWQLKPRRRRCLSISRMLVTKVKSLHLCFECVWLVGKWRKVIDCESEFSGSDLFCPESETCSGKILYENLFGRLI